MKLTESTTDDGWCFAWRTAAGHLVEAEWIPAREVWVRRSRNLVPGTNRLGAWSLPQEVALPSPTDHDHAREIAAAHAERKPR